MKKQYIGVSYQGELSPEALDIVREFDGSDEVSASETDIAGLPNIEEARSVNGLAHHDIQTPSERVTIGEEWIETGRGRLSLRTYTPAGRSGLPVLVFAHGGCWVFCSVETHDGMCKYLADKAECLVVSVDYALAPEYPFPQGLEDVLAATQWCHENADQIGGDSTRIAIGGDSAGGNLAAMTALKIAQMNDFRLCKQLLIYPICDVLDSLSDSMQTYAEGYFFTKAVLDWASHLYLGEDGEQLKAKAASPSHLLSNLDLAALAPAFILSAECDILKDQALKYGESLTSQGGDVSYSQYQGMPHAFLAMAGTLDLGKQALDECAETLKKAFVSS